ncbi:thiamine phosphate pyrophosphorylase [Acetobacter nitrogenifigens DSM 23921 = NBRC 105050]|uniref:Thiamine-phosphate synthase n=1 Tax=Acetobacter nitrogenifigens DSM 23921 = NBRC 105050 TaxID=1120919 RepID=A0A511XCV5_9PROT|nr:thiamine phosphate synthase [Acetobacter nitrogenifigens]GBQ91707.1 thiamine phosphate pyrophosphorylase [Acetobacter nitrogenifigens DSM 23921 = NBRC 105050]GEN60793.1 thiamine-phosphate synthase [Acetobacter nitrogenifigens DSM 23921 = NBRC 105050]
MSDRVEQASDETTACELYLVTPVVDDGDAFLPVLERALAKLPAAAVRLRLADLPEDRLKRIVTRLRPSVQDRGVALILDSHPSLALSTGCDGVHVDAEDTATARLIVGNDLQLGAFCGTSRDLAMTAGEAGADYVSFGPFTQASEITSDAELVGWWSAVMELPAVAEVTIDAGGDYAAALRPLAKTADFLALGGDEGALSPWSDPAGALAALSGVLTTGL